MKVLVVGNGAREHAIAWKLSKSSLLSELYCAPGNPGTALIAQNIELKAGNLGALALWAVEKKIDLTVVGPEAPLVEGIVDIFTQHGLRIFGPSKEAARLESSKSFAKDVMQKAGVPTPVAVVFENFDEAKRYVEQQGAPIVIKVDGLAAGKGVTVAMTVEQAIVALEEAMVSNRFGDSGQRVVVEEYIEGKEASVIAIVDGRTVLPLVVSQDYKRLLNCNEGPNTGGMGAISPTPVLSDQAVEDLVAKIFIPVIQELWARKIKYVGFLYAGVIVDARRDIKVLEFNCRLGDPETEVLLPRMRSDLLTVLNAAVDGNLASVELEWTNDVVACVVLSSRGYPGDPEDGKVIEGVAGGAEDERVLVFHAGTKHESENKDVILSKGGRILCVTAIGESLENALANVYRRIEGIKFEGMYYRTDIGKS